MIDTQEFSISKKRKRSVKGKIVNQNIQMNKINLRRNISSIAQSRRQRELDKERMKKDIESQRRRKIMEKQKNEDLKRMDSERIINKVSPKKSNTISKSPNANYLISGTPGTSIALMDQQEGGSPQKRPESERSLPISKAKSGKNHGVKEEPANMKKFQEEMKNRNSKQQNRRKIGDLDDSVNVTNFDSMELNRVTHLQSKKKVKPKKKHENFIKQSIPKKSPKKDESPIKKMKKSSRTPLHKKMSSKVPQKPKSEMLDATFDEKQLKNMGTNEFLDFYDKKYQNKSGEYEIIGEENETNNQTMNTTDMLNEDPGKHSFSKDISKDISKDLIPVKKRISQQKDEDESFTNVNTTKVIHREVHDPEMKMNFKKKEENGDFKDSNSLQNDLFSQTQTQIKKDLPSSKQTPKKLNFSKRNNIKNTRTSHKPENQIPATKRLAQGSGQKILVPKQPNEPKIVGRTPPKKVENKPRKEYIIPTPSLQSTISKSQNQSESDIRVEDSDPGEFNYSGDPNIPMTSQIGSDKRENTVTSKSVKNYEILKFPNDSKLKMDSELPEVEINAKKDPFSNTLDSRARERIENGEFQDDTQNMSFTEKSENHSPRQTISDFDQRIDKNQFLLSDLPDPSQKEKRTSHNTAPIVEPEKSEEKLETQSQKHPEITKKKVKEESSSDEEVFLLNPTKSPNIRKMRKKKKKKPSKSKKHKNPFHDSEEEEQQFSEPITQMEEIVPVQRKPSPQIDVSSDFMITAVSTPNIKKKKKPKRKKSKRKNKKKHYSEAKPPKKSYNLLENNKMSPQFNTLGNARGQPRIEREEPVTIVQDQNVISSPNYATLKKTNRERPKQSQRTAQPSRIHQNQYTPNERMPNPQQPMMDGRFTLGKQMERTHPISQRGRTFQTEKPRERSRTYSSKKKSPERSQSSPNQKRAQIKKMLRNSRRRLRKEIEENQTKNSMRSRSPKDRINFAGEDALDYENRMNKYALKGINREKLKKDVYLNNSILNQKIPELNSQLQKDLDNYKVSDVKRSLRAKATRLNGRKSNKKDRKDRLRRLEQEIAELTMNVEQQVEDNEVFKAKVNKKYDNDED